MARSRFLILAAVLGAGIAGYARLSTKPTDDDLAKRVTDINFQLSDAIRQASSGSQVPLMAKFKLEGESLILSVWVAENGFTKDASYNVMKQKLGSVAGDKWNPADKPFTDLERVAKASYQWTLWALSEKTLLDAVTTIEQQGVGRILVAEPRFDGRQPFFRVIAAREGKAQEYKFDMKTWEPLEKNS